MPDENGSIAEVPPAPPKMMPHEAVRLAADGTAPPTAPEPPLTESAVEQPEEEAPIDEPALGEVAIGDSAPEAEEEGNEE